MLTRRRFLTGLIAAVGVPLLASCAAVMRSSGQSATSSSSPTSSPVHQPPASPSPYPPTMSVREKAAQLLIVGFRGLTGDEAAPIIADVSERGLGGVLLFSRDHLTGGPRNVASPEQLRTLVADLRAAPGVAPLIVAIDQEGGRVARLGPEHGFPATTEAAALGATGDPEATRAAAAAMAATLATVGITLNLAPVVDLDLGPANPIIGALGRSFGADPAAVTAHAREFIEAHHRAGIACAIKHFPGHGSATADTHLGAVDVTGAWSETELEPFAALAAAGLADAVLTAHVYNAALDADHPATLSGPTIDGILRQRLGYAGPVLSDDLQMGAVVDAYGFEESIALALEAGVDLLLFANQLVYEPDVVARAVDVVESLVTEGRISEERLDLSLERTAPLRVA